METMTLYRPTGAAELELVKQSGYKKWPPRLLEQPIFIPLLIKPIRKKLQASGMCQKVGLDTSQNLKSIKYLCKVMKYKR